jgi:hypothetical protein
VSTVVPGQVGSNGVVEATYLGRPFSLRAIRSAGSVTVGQEAAKIS